MQIILVTNMHFKYLNRLHVMLGLSWKHSGAPWVMKWKKAIKRWVKTALGQSVTQTEVAVKVVCLLVSRLLLAGEVASFIGTEDAHCYTQKDRHHNHYAQDDSSNVDVIYKKKGQAWDHGFAGCLYHMWKGDQITYKLPSSAVHIQRSQPHSWLCSSILQRPPSWPHWISEDQ